VESDDEDDIELVDESDEEDSMAKGGTTNQKKRRNKTNDLDQQVVSPGADPSEKNLDDTDGAEVAETTTSIVDRDDHSVDNEEEIKEMQATLEQSRATQEQLLDDLHPLPQVLAPLHDQASSDTETFHVAPSS
ncbi:hypothetical protein Dimus_016224, partial [Dionaea muscipula]